MGKCKYCGKKAGFLSAANYLPQKIWDENLNSYSAGIIKEVCSGRESIPKPVQIGDILDITDAPSVRYTSRWVLH